MAAALVVPIAASALPGSEPVSELDPGRSTSATNHSGGETTVFDATRQAFSLPAANLREEHRASFFVGNSFFNQNWVIAPSSTAARDGLGPLFNARSCSACHFKDGRSRPPEAGASADTLVLRISRSGTNAVGGPNPDPVYGGQIQTVSVPGVLPEADVRVNYIAVEGHYPDGDAYTLRKPVVDIRDPRYGPVRSDLLTSSRMAPVMIGLGLLEAIPESALHALEDPDDRDGDGISGRLNLVWDHVAGSLRVGRFGWKAEQPSILQQTAGAFIEDIGITSDLFLRENHTATQMGAIDQPSGGSPEISRQILDAVVLYASTLAVPAQRDTDSAIVQNGSRLFKSLGCAACHLPNLQTGEKAGFQELSHQSIQPFTDLLLHDMGEGLADHRPTFLANGREWRTPPLWGLGLIEKVNGHTFLLHDGRARNIVEAILWHDGEGNRAQAGFRQLPRAEREALVSFLESL
jgi:CxxC motif-containing protein (DUF1111 family)